VESPESEKPRPAGEPEPGEPAAPPVPRDAVARAHRVPRSPTDRSGYLRLDLGESARPASPRVLQALQALGPSDLCRYPDPWPLQQALARHHGVEPHQIGITAGADEAIRWSFGAYVEEGARVILLRPTFGALLAAAEATGAFVERVDYLEDLSFPLDDFRKVLTPRTPRMAVLANPDAPTGTAPNVQDILSLCRESPQTLFLVNETFVRFHGQSLLDPSHQANRPPNLLVLRSLSKDHGLAGLRVGYLVGHQDVIATLNVVRPSYTVSGPSIAGALAALAEQDAVQAHVLQVRAVMERLVAKLATRSIEARATRANFVLVKLTAPIQTWAAAFAAHKVLVGTWGHVGPLASFVRVTVNDDDEAAQFLDTLDLVLRQGVPGAARVDGVPGAWEDVLSEGMA